MLCDMARMTRDMMSHVTDNLERYESTCEKRRKQREIERKYEKNRPIEPPRL